MMINEIRNICLSDQSEQVIQGKHLNKLPPPEREPLWKGFLLKFKDPLMIVLLVAFVLSVAVSVYEITTQNASYDILLEPAGVLIALLLATGVGFIVEVKAAREFELLNKVKDSRRVKVLRKTADGTPRIINIEKQDVVVGDIVSLENGDEIPADGELLAANSLSVDESAFTGEPYTTKTTDRSQFDENATYPSDFLLRGSMVIEGTAFMKVTAVGIDSEEGKGTALAQEGSEVRTPLNAQLDRLGKQVSVASFVVGALIIISRMAYCYLFHWDYWGSSWLLMAEYTLQSLMIAITLIVVAVPEGLPMSINISLALSMRKMLRENCLVRKLHACETMGATTVICTDKTGTLTQNKMQVAEMKIFGSIDKHTIYSGIAQNTTATLNIGEDGKAETIGNPTEAALLLWMNEQGEDYRQWRDGSKVESQVPFSTERKYMETTIADKDGEEPIRFIKGAPEVVMAMACNGSEEMTVQIAEYQQKAMRTLGFAYQRGNEKPVFYALAAISDPLRDDVAEAIHRCTDDAGVRVIIVTGDSLATAKEIGRQLGLQEGMTLTGTEFAAMNDEKILSDVLPTLRILSRARPDDKARLVRLLQKRGEVVAVTGDGTNDAPALSKAQVGLSMGDGTARAKEASDITIIDNSFASICKAILWGRSLYINIRRFILFQITINVCACLIVLFGAMIGEQSPLTVTQMLWVNLIMDTFAAMALSALPPDERVMKMKPRNPNSHIIDRPMALQIIVVGLLFFVCSAAYWVYITYYNDEVGRYDIALFFTFFVMMQFWNLFNARYFRTGRSLVKDILSLARGKGRFTDYFCMPFLGIASAIIIGQIIIVNFFGEMFSVCPIDFSDWVYIIIVTSPILVVGEIIRLVKS
ncbi:MAG: calcium-translocating P-type ATPase, PMCA-type [Prevotella sp.]|nr:calcium-translocating P-type ATPase, PMCA-type [Prevotella sp.]